mmetsp:Transcript_16709/g.27722  ORF Transcript_16709/g.27722 Transcript_16709/m.27722 type:complete len:93 (+) Transcript_16709:52-330(+)|eukprot:CAMPEP_0119020560 /NCGR_PEP_ID=MMETSP1176-20130426/24326_1 /TAXON_ID=265551 /ORGANISM="Synedropsis recta cf, Strain CCMP1620" /LENGTH=92 /DNA_ID=CAMNT_0006975013 /DNA_START=40 /DNA_END=318 /DNA_ORIENTATION=-
MPTNPRRNVEKELVQSRHISWKVAKALTNTAIQQGCNGDDAIFEGAKEIHSQNPEAYFSSSKKKLHRQKSENTSSAQPSYDGGYEEDIEYSA